MKVHVALASPTPNSLEGATVLPHSRGHSSVLIIEMLAPVSNIPMKFFPHIAGVQPRLIQGIRRRDG